MITLSCSSGELEDGLSAVMAYLSLVAKEATLHSLDIKHSDYSHNNDFYLASVSQLKNLGACKLYFRGDVLADEGSVPMDLWALGHLEQLEVLHLTLLEKLISVPSAQLNA
ncbi:hypothetical protein D9758_008124 [Tetrapyrgos nigripes]|uniref:Uncharacterized protein n=1 Tax=Tetrapyrgos nigripes TaxID=182062 RepID=A0A8H5LP90_9AGAR|nr:hypothetical protein D9758_008124 [Tetrapyrgos nigripes]